MDELKLNRWIENFNKEAGKLQIEFDLLFQDSGISDSYKLEVDADSQLLNLVITNDDLPREIRERLGKLLIATKPEDSV